MPLLSSLIFSLLLVAFCAFLRIELLSDLGIRLAYITFFPAVIFSTLARGFIAGFSATVLSSLFVIFWQQPDGSHFLNDSIDWVGLGIFIFNGILISVISWQLILARSSERKVESLFNNILENAPIGMHIATLDGRIMQSNRAMRELVGLQKDDFEKLLISDLTYSDDRDLSKENFECLLAGAKNAVYEKRYIHKDGYPIWVQVTLSLERDQSGNPLYFIGQVENISKRKQAENLLFEKDAALIEGQKVLNSILNHTPAMIGYWNNDLTNKFGNKTYQEWFGFGPENMHGKHIRDILGEKLYALNEPYLQAVLRGEPQLFERTIIDVSGRERYTQASYLPDISNGQVNGFFVLVTDITELKIAQLRISQSEASLRAMYDNLPFLAWMKDTKGFYVQANKHLIKSAGLASLADVQGKTDFDFWPKALAEHYRAVDEEVMQNRQQKKLIEKCIDSRVEYWVETIKSPVVDEQGRILGTIGLARDITEEREKEEKLKLAASIYESSSEGMVVTDIENKILAVNSAFTQITGYSAAEVIGKDPKILSSGCHDKFFYKDMWDSINSKGFWQGEICDKKKTGEFHTKRMTINVIPDN